MSVALLLTLAAAAVLLAVYVVARLIQILHAVEGGSRHWLAGATHTRYAENELALFESGARRARKKEPRR